VAVVNTNSNTVVNNIPVGNGPDAMVETANSLKLYVANQIDNTVDGFNTSDRSARTVNGTFNGPLWMVARSDSQRLYVLNGNGVVSTIDTTSTAGPDNQLDASVNVPGAINMLYDVNLNRLYIPNSGGLTMLDVSQSIPAVITGGPIPTCPTQPSNCIPTVPPSLRAATDPCSVTSPQSLTVVAVASLPDGSRAYVGAYYVDANDNICPQVTEIDEVSNTVASSTAIPGYPDATNPSNATYYVPVCASTRFRFNMAAGGDSSRAYFASCDGGVVDIIDTTTESYILNLAEPVGTRPPIPPNPQNPPQNTVFMISGP
jgi:DNA-binding beta-propeller fold protein YncE